jgi:hypothetical protein
MNWTASGNSRPSTQKRSGQQVETANPPHKKMANPPHGKICTASRKTPTGTSVQHAAARGERPWLQAVKEREAVALYTVLAVKEKGPRLFTQSWQSRRRDRGSSMQIWQSRKGAACTLYTSKRQEGASSQHQDQSTISDLKLIHQRKRPHQHKNQFTEVAAEKRERSEGVYVQMLQGRVIFIVRERG